MMMKKWFLTNYDGLNIAGTIKGAISTNFTDIKVLQKIVDAHNKEVSLLQEEIEKLKEEIEKLKIENIYQEAGQIVDQDFWVTLAAREMNPKIPQKGN